METLIIAISVLVLLVCLAFILVISIMIFKSNRATMEINPEKYEIERGDAVRGELILKFYKPLKIKTLSIFLKGSSALNNELKESKNVLEENVSLPIGDKSYEFYLETPYRRSEDKDDNKKWYICAELECEGFKDSKKVKISVK